MDTATNAATDAEPSGAPDLHAAARAVAEDWSAITASAEGDGASREEIERILAAVGRTLSHQLAAVHAFDLPGAARALCVIDLDGDGEEELLVSSERGEVVCFDRGGDGDWQAVEGGAAVPAGPVIGLELGSARGDEVIVARLVLAPEEPGGKDRFFTLALEPERLKIDPVQAHGAANRRVLGVRAGRPAIDGIVSAAVVSGPQGPVLRVILPLGDAGEQPLAIRPTCLVHTTHRIWVGDSQETVWCWQWSDDALQPAADWPAAGLGLDGQITALALWRSAPEAPWLLLAATDERFLVAVDGRGDVRWKIRTPTVVTGLAALPTDGLLAVADEDGRLELCHPLRPPLQSRPVPRFCEVLQRLDAGEQRRTLHRWLASDRVDRVAAAVRCLLDLGDFDQELLRAHLLRGDDDPQASGVMLAALAELESTALEASADDDPALALCLRLCRAFYLRCHLRLRSRIDQITARLAARFGERLQADDDYRWLDRARRRGDCGHAETCFELGRGDDGAEHLRAALSLCRLDVLAAHPQLLERQPLELEE